MDVKNVMYLQLLCGKTDDFFWLEEASCTVAVLRLVKFLGYIGDANEITHAANLMPSCERSQTLGDLRRWRRTCCCHGWKWGATAKIVRLTVGLGVLFFKKRVSFENLHTTFQSWLLRFRAFCRGFITLIFSVSSCSPVFVWWLWHQSWRFLLDPGTPLSPVPAAFMSGLEQIASWEMGHLSAMGPTTGWSFGVKNGRFNDRPWALKKHPWWWRSKIKNDRSYSARYGLKP